jgi:hypothetical protein
MWRFVGKYEVGNLQIKVAGTQCGTWPFGAITLTSTSISCWRSTDGQGQHPHRGARRGPGRIAVVGVDR